MMYAKQQDCYLRITLYGVLTIYYIVYSVIYNIVISSDNGKIGNDREYMS